MRKKIITTVSLLVTIFMGMAQEIQRDRADQEIEFGKEKILRSDTIYRSDTVCVREVITRTDVINRTEQIVRYYDSKLPADTLSENRLLSEPVSRPGGSYVWVPDSMEGKVEKVLHGAPLEVITTLYDGIDLNEKVIFRGDTINMILKDRNLGRYDRGLFNFLFIPKGIWQVGLTASYGEFSTANLQILDLVSDVDFRGKLWSIRPYFQYFLKSNISVGLRLGYTEGKASIGAFNVDIDEDMSFNLHDILYKSNSYSAAVTFSQYLGIARKGRFGVFNEVELALSGGNSDFHRPFNGELRKTHTDTFQAALNFSPGVCVFVLDQVSFNVSLGVFGLNVKHEKQKVDGEELGWRTTSGANFRFNIFNINFGIAVNI
ncbi:MAG: hypothetical protein J1F38_03745 [Muribaculaceae bacterium]|nr:hypothetical protein [Muribaculaceae bacterium]